MIFVLILFWGNVIIYAFGIYKIGNDINWFVQLIQPLIFAFGVTSINRNGKLTLTQLNTPETYLESIESHLSKRYKRAECESGKILLVKETAIGRCMDFFFREQVRIKHGNDEILILSKKRTLESIEREMEQYN